MAVGVVNRNRTVLASASRTTTQTSADFNNNSAKGVLVFVDITVVPGSAPSLVTAIQMKDPVSLKYITINPTITALTGTGTAVYIIYPGLSATEEGGFTMAVNAPLPKTWRVVVTAGNANACTYSVGAVELI